MHFRYAFCTQNYHLSLGHDYFEVANVADDFAMAGTATADALAQVRNLIVILETCKTKKSDVLKTNLMGKQIANTTQIPHGNKHFGKLAR